MKNHCKLLLYGYIQFKQREDFIDWIIKGSVNGKAYGVNGVGGGKMPGYGAVLTQSDIELIIDYLRGMEPDAWNNEISSLV